MVETFLGQKLTNDVACDAGADAVKFQMIGPDFLLGDRTVEYTYPILSGEELLRTCTPCLIRVFLR